MKVRHKIGFLLSNDDSSRWLHGADVGTVARSADPHAKEIDVTYYRVDFVAAKLISRPAKRFRTEEQAKKHARRVLGVAGDIDLASWVTIVAVSRNGTPV